MSILLADNFNYKSRKALDSRIICDTIADLVGMAESTIYDGIITYVKTEKKYYKI